MNILSWNARRLEDTSKRHILHDLICDYKIDIIAIQETKKQNYHKDCLGVLIYILIFG
jgi:exonuclease III